MMLAYSRLMASNFYGCFTHETCGSEDCSNFEQKQCRNDIAQGMLTTCNDDPDLLKKVITCDGSWVYGCDIETTAQSPISLLFSSIAMAWCIVNSRYKVARPINSRT